MKVTKIQISNILGIQSLEYEPGKITEISGKNAVGKTSFLRAIQGAVGGGHDAKLLREGTTEGEVVLIFDNGEKLTKKMTKYKSDLKFEDADGRKLKLGATYIKEIIDPVGLNPINILTADPKERINLLLDSVPMEIPVEAIKFITGADISDDDRHPLKIIEEKRKGIYDERAYLNGEITKQETMISEMRKTIPHFHGKEKVKDWASEVGLLRGNLEQKQEEYQGKVADEAKEHNDSMIAAREMAQEEIDLIKDKLSKFQEDAANEDRKVLDELSKEFTPQLDELKEKIREADQNSKNEAQIKGAVDFVEKHEKEKVSNEESAATYSEQLNSLDALKAELLLTLPVEGLEVKDGNIFIKGVSFDTLNEAARIRFCLMIAGLRKTKLPLVCVDGLEALDEEVYKLFKAEAEKTDMQFFVTRVNENESLTIN